MWSYKSLSSSSNLGEFRTNGLGEVWAFGVYKGRGGEDNEEVMGLFVDVL